MLGYGRSEWERIITSEMAITPLINFFERLHKIAAINDVRGIEITNPNNVNFENLAQAKKELDAHQLKIVSVGIEHVCDAEWQFGSLL